MEENREKVVGLKAIQNSNVSLKSALQDTENKLEVVKKDYEKLSETPKNTNKENQVLRVNLEKKSISEKAAIENHDDQMKKKNEEIKSLILTRKVSVENATKLQHLNQTLEKEIEEIKVKNAPTKESKLPYPCDKCECTFRTAGLLIKHVKSDH